MTPEEKFLVDLQGYLVIKNVLTPAEVAALNAIADEKFARPAGVTGRQSSRVSTWGPPYQALIDHPRIVPYLVELIDSKFRLDHDYCIFMQEGDAGGSLHGGEGHEGDHWYKYRDGVIRNGLCVITFFLTPAAEGDGGFACIPGTHKSHFLDAIPSDVRRFERPAPYVVQPAVEAGDALFFTEALIHGTMTWRARHERRALLYKYSPGHSAWSQNYYNLDDYANLTEQQRRILAPPSVGSRPDVVQPAA
ncbi:MAG TPA: phytanoyl-CoA dioxygenase family protein [Chthonomonadaceae bacterium]|nr:phytanoyl-CoA dioxygenase family protein [Chthonomonadaceae bacterium]